MTPIVIDLEWNHPQPGRVHINGLPGEIIQIGAAKIDENCQVLDSFDQIVRPVFYPKMNKDIQNLTQITNDDLAKGLPFAKVIEDFKAWCKEDFVFVSWGPDDWLMLKRNLQKFRLDTSWLPRAYDAQLMFDDMEMQEDKSWALNYALYHYNEKPDGAHNALADVLSTIKVLKHLDIKEGVSDEYFRCDPEEN